MIVRSLLLRYERNPKYIQTRECVRRRRLSFKTGCAEICIDMNLDRTDGWLRLEMMVLGTG